MIASQRIGKQINRYAWSGSVYLRSTLKLDLYSCVHWNMPILQALKNKLHLEQRILKPKNKACKIYTFILSNNVHEH